MLLPSRSHCCLEGHRVFHLLADKALVHAFMSLYLSWKSKKVDVIMCDECLEDEIIPVDLKVSSFHLFNALVIVLICLIVQGLS